jgi:hypothetical protein
MVVDVGKPRPDAPRDASTGISFAAHSALCTHVDPPFGVLYDLRMWRIGLLAVLVVVVGCNRKASEGTPSEAGSATSAPTPPTPQKIELTEPQEAVAVIRVLWPQVKAADAATFRWAGCSDRTVGYDNARACLDRAFKEVEDIKSQIPPKLLIKTPCGLETEKVHRAFVANQLAYLGNVRAWFDKNASTLKRLMVSKSRWEAADSMGKAADEYPIALSEKYGGGLPAIYKLPCLQPILRCPSMGCNFVQFDNAAEIPR